MRYLIITLFSLFVIGANAQVFQPQNIPYKFKGLKADSLLIIPVGCDTPLTSNPKWGTATDGALFLKTCDTTLWVKIGQRYIQVNGTASITGGDTTIFEVTLDSTGQPNNRLLFARNNYISSSPRILIDSLNSRLIINNTNVSTGGAGMQLYVVGNGTIAGFLRVGTFEIYGISTAVTDTTAYKPLAINSSGSVRKLDRWPGGGGGSSIDTTSLSNRINLKADKSITLTAGDGLVGGGDLSANRSFRVDTSQVANKIWVTDRLASLGTVTSVSTDATLTGGPITTSGTLKVDTLVISTRAWRDKLADSLGAIIATKQATGNYITALTGDVTASGPGSAVATLSNTGVTAGSYTNLNATIGADGRITAASNGSGGTLSSDSLAVRRVGPGSRNHIVSFDSQSGGSSASSLATSASRDSSNIFIGNESGNASTDAFYNIGLGNSSLKSITVGAGNMAIGNSALASLTQSYRNTAVGQRALTNFNGGAGFTRNTGIGAFALSNLTTGTDNIGIGTESGNGTTDQSYNIFIGNNTGGGNATNRIGIGFLLSNVGAYSLIIDNAQGSTHSTGGLNTHVGYNSSGGGTGIEQSHFGLRAGSGVTGSGNTAIGVNSIGSYPGSTTHSGTYNSALGYEAGFNSSSNITGSYNVGIGHRAQWMSATGSSQFVLGGNNIRWLISDVSGSTRRWLFNATTTDVTAIANSSAALEINGTSLGFLPPRGTATQRNAIGTPVKGLHFVDTDSSRPFFYDGSVWKGLAFTGEGGGGSMVYPSAGIAVSTGSAWGTSITDNSTDWNTAYTDRLKWDGGATGLTASTGRTSLGATTVGSNFFTLTNPSAITFPQINADNTVTTNTAAQTRTALSVPSTTEVDIEYRKSLYQYFNDFVSPVSSSSNTGADFYFTGTGTGTANSSAALSAGNQYGLLTVSTGTTATGRASVQTSSNSFRLGNGTWVYETKVNIATLSDVTNRYSFITGFWDATTANQTDAVAFVYDEGGVSTGSTAAAYWQVVTASNSTRTWNTSLTQITVTAGQYYTLRIEINAAGTEAVFKVDGTTVSTITTNIPTASGREVGFGSQILKSIGTTARTFLTDYTLAKSALTTPR